MPNLQILTIPKPLPRPGDAAGALYLTEVDLTAEPPDSDRTERYTAAARL